MIFLRNIITEYIYISDENIYVIIVIRRIVANREFSEVIFIIEQFPVHPLIFRCLFLIKAS